ncbi:hypothetical protein, partial [Vibrio splendidus]|uniref:hypothetical protein n=1 Tax=Vibrio splendidus TaxID=29497 RepID=UPI001F52A7B7
FGLSVGLSSYRSIFATMRAGSTGASKPDVFRMSAFFVLTMQLFTAQGWLAAGEHFVTSMVSLSRSVGSVATIFCQALLYSRRKLSGLG